MRLLIALLIAVLSALVHSGNAAIEFTGYRMQQYDLQGTAFGSSMSVASYDLRTLRAPYFQIKCIISRVRELATSSFKHLRDVGAGSLLIILPSSWPDLTSQELEDIREVEEELMSDRWMMPVYFAVDTPELSSIYAKADAISVAQAAQSAGKPVSISTQWFGDGYHMVTPFKAEKQSAPFVVSNVKASLSGLGAEDSLPTIVIVAHHDASGAVPSLSFGYDGNGSGVSALLELSRILSRFYSTSKTHPKFNIQFVLSGAGKYNYLGSKQYIDSLPESTHASTAVGNSGVQFVLCLDSLESAVDGWTLYGHVSKPPKENSPLDVFFKHLQSVAGEMGLEEPVFSHKKINLAASRLSWEHERFSIRRLPALTLSSHPNAHSRVRETITDLPNSQNSNRNEKLCSNVKMVGEALARYIFDMPLQSNGSSLSLLGAPSVEPDCGHLGSMRKWYSSNSRAAQFNVQSTKSSQGFVANLQSYLGAWLPNAQITNYPMEKREPDLVFYENMEVKLSAFVVKPAIYDLFVGCGVGIYLGFFYLIILNYPALFRRASRMVLFFANKKSKAA